MCTSPFIQSLHSFLIALQVLSSKHIRQTSLLGQTEQSNYQSFPYIVNQLVSSQAQPQQQEIMHQNSLSRQNTDPEKANLQVPIVYPEQNSSSSYHTASFQNEQFSFITQHRKKQTMSFKQRGYAQNNDSLQKKENHPQIKKLNSYACDYKQEMQLNTEWASPWEQISLGRNQSNSENELKLASALKQKTFQKLKQLQRTVKVLKESIYLLKAEMRISLINTKFLEDNITCGFNIIKDEHNALKNLNVELKKKVVIMTQQNSALKSALEESRSQLIKTVRQNSFLVQKLRCKTEETTSDVRPVNILELNPSFRFFRHKHSNEEQKRQSQNLQNHSQVQTGENQTSFKNPAIVQSNKQQINSGLKKLREKVQRLKERISHQNLS